MDIKHKGLLKRLVTQIGCDASKTTMRLTMKDLSTICEAYIAQLQNAEPVAWIRMRDGEIDWGEDCLYSSEQDFYDFPQDIEGLTCKPLYLHPFSISTEPVAYCRRDTIESWQGQTINAAMMFPSPKGLKEPVALFTHPPKDSTEPIGTWQANSANDGMRFPEQSDLISGLEEVRGADWKPASKDSSVKRDADYHVISDSGDGIVAMSSAVAGQLLYMRDMFDAKDYEEAYTALINLADPNLSHLNTWQDLERIAATKSPHYATPNL